MSRRSRERAEARMAAQAARKNRRRPDRMLVSAIMLFFFTAFLLISFDGELEWEGFALSVIVPVLIRLSTMWLPRFFPADKLLLAIANFLCALGVLILYSTDRGAGTSRGIQQAIYYGAGIIAMLVCIFVVRYVRRWNFLMLIIMIGAAGLLALPLAIGTEQNGATNWINLGGTSVRPANWSSWHASWGTCRAQAFCAGFFAVFSLLVLMLQQDLWAQRADLHATTLFLFCASTGSLPLTGLGTCLVGPGGAAVAAGYIMFAHVKKRVAIWRNPWIYYGPAAIRSCRCSWPSPPAALFGVGTGLGAPRVIPVYFTTDCTSPCSSASSSASSSARWCWRCVILILQGVSPSPRRRAAASTRCWPWAPPSCWACRPLSSSAVSSSSSPSPA